MFLLSIFYTYRVGQKVGVGSEERQILTDTNEITTFPNAVLRKCSAGSYINCGLLCFFINR